MAHLEYKDMCQYSDLTTLSNKIYFFDGAFRRSLVLLQSLLSFAGIVIEAASGMTYRDFLQQNIFSPLKMKHTSYDPDSVEFNNLKAVGYDHVLKVPSPISVFLHPTAAFSAGGMFSTIKAMFKWHQALKTNQLVYYETLKKIFTPGLLTMVMAGISKIMKSPVRNVP